MACHCRDAVFGLPVELGAPSTELLRGEEKAPAVEEALAGCSPDLTQLALASSHRSEIVTAVASVRLLRLESASPPVVGGGGPPESSSVAAALARTLLVHVSTASLTDVARSVAADSRA